MFFKEDMLKQCLEILSSATLITGLVIVMMMLIECINVWSKGKFTGDISRSKPLQVVISALLGSIPGCMGGFAVVSMYTHGIVSFGALVAMMIASSGDESFVMLAMFPRQALLIMCALFVLAVIAGLLTDAIYKPLHPASCSEGKFVTHTEESIRGERHFGWKRVVIIVGVFLFLAALCLGFFEEEHETGADGALYVFGGINLLSEDWMNVLFAFLGLSVLAMAVLASDHFVEEHLWHHVLREHFPKIFLWTAGTLAAIAILLHFIDITSWIGDNVVLMVLIAAAIGLIPESGPHLIFVTMFASGIVSLPVLVASCISQDGHAGLPLLAVDRRTFVVAKALNAALAAAVGLAMLL